MRIENSQEQDFAYVRDIHKPFGELDRVLDFCKSELSSTWRWKLLQASSDIADGQYRFFFSDEKDAVVFALKWQ